MEWPLIMLQAFSGAVVATVSSFALQSLFDVLLLRADDTPELRQRSALISSAIVLVVVPWLVAGGVYGLGRLSNNYEGSYWWTLLGAYVGEALSFGMAFVWTAIDPSPTKDTARLVRFIMDGLLTAVGTVVFYVLFRKPLQSVIPIGSLLEWRSGRWVWGIPMPRFSRSPLITPSLSFSLLSGRF